MLLVTGGTGYLGSALVELLVARGRQVRVLVRDPARAHVLPGAVQLVLGDLDDTDALYRAADGCDAVLHVAASLGQSAGLTHHVNVGGTDQVLAAATAAGASRLVYTSSSAAIIDSNGLVSERAAPGTVLTDAYSTSKAEAERLVLGTAGIEAVIVNPVNVYGPSPAGPQSYNGLFAAAARGEITEIVDAPVGWVLAADAALGHLLALDRGVPGRRYVACGEVAPFGRVLNRFAELVGSPHRVRVLPPGSALPADASLFARRSEVYGRLAPVRVDDAQARALGLIPRGVDDGLKITAEWMIRSGTWRT